MPLFVVFVFAMTHLNNTFRLASQYDTRHVKVCEITKLNIKLPIPAKQMFV